jgi:hypothetical protein
MEGFTPGDRIKTVSKRDPFEQWDLLLSEEQTPHIVEKPENRTYPMEPKEASRGLHTQEVAGSSPAAPTSNQQIPLKSPRARGLWNPFDPLRKPENLPDSASHLPAKDGE